MSMLRCLGGVMFKLTHLEKENTSSLQQPQPNVFFCFFFDDKQHTRVSCSFLLKKKDPQNWNSKLHQRATFSLLLDISHRRNKFIPVGDFIVSDHQVVSDPKMKCKHVISWLSARSASFETHCKKHRIIVQRNLAVSLRDSVILTGTPDALDTVGILSQRPLRLCRSHAPHDSGRWVRVKSGGASQSVLYDKQRKSYFPDALVDESTATDSVSDRDAIVSQLNVFEALGREVDWPLEVIRSERFRTRVLRNGGTRAS